jgi:hypothetical protein
MKQEIRKMFGPPHLCRGFDYIGMGASLRIRRAAIEATIQITFARSRA